MGWFSRWKRRMRNLASDGEYAGSHSAGPSSAKAERNAKAQFETQVNRPDRSGGRI